MKNREVFFYDKKYKTSLEKREELALYIKQTIYSLFLNIPFLKKKLSYIDIHYHNLNQGKRLKRNYYQNPYISKSKTSIFDHRKLEMPSISFFDVIEIDNFQNFQKELINKFSNKHSEIISRISFKENLIKDLSKIKINLDTSSHGRLINIDFNKIQAINSDLLGFIEISYIKTEESYFILHLNVRTSEKFNTLYSKIINSREIEYSTKHFHSFMNILKHKVFNSHTSSGGTLIQHNIDNLISDLKFQVTFNLLKPFQGYFYTSKLNPNIPTVIHYSIENFLNLKKDYRFSNFLRLKQARCFSSKDHLFDFYLNQEYNTVLIIKEKGHGKKEPLEKDLTNYDWLESYSAIQDIAFVCVFESILNIEFLKLNQIKRRTYDLIKHSNRWMLLNFISIFKYNINYFKLKKEIAVLNLTTSRYKNEFSKNSILFLTNRYSNLSNYNYVSVFKNEKKEINLSEYILSH